jgi:hypothetical protein
LIGLGGPYGYAFKLVKLSKIAIFDDIIARDSVRSGSGGALKQRWIPDCADYKDLSAQSMTHHRFLQIKKVVKLRNNLIAPKKGDAGYNPIYKYDIIYNVLGQKCKCNIKVC